MGDFFDITPEETAFIKGVFDDMLTVWGVKCRLYFDGTETVCPNCIINPRTGESTNRYKTGGPIPFDAGEICPVCEGRGRISGTGSTQDITMTIDWKPKEWAQISGESGEEVVKLPAGTVMTRGSINDLPQVLSSQFVVLDADNIYLSNKYVLWTQPYVSGALSKNRYFFAYWRKIK